MTQELLNLSGQELKERGTKLALIHNEEWRARFFAIAARLLEFGHVSSDEIIPYSGMPPGSPNAVGAAMLAFAKKHGLVVDHYRKSSRPSCHSAVVGVWRRK